MTASGEGNDTRTQWHHLLLNFAGWIQDDVVATARQYLALGQEDQVARLVAEATATGLVPFTADHAAVLRRLLTEQGQDASAVRAGIRETVGVPPFTMMAGPPSGIGPSTRDDVDGAAVAAAVDLGALRLWRSWRYPPHGLLPPRRVFLIQAPEGSDLPTVAYRMQQALAQAGEPDPQVEALTSETPVPPYSVQALDAAEQLWPE